MDWGILQRTLREAIRRSPPQPSSGEQFATDAADSQVGATLRIRLPEDWTAQDTRQLVDAPALSEQRFVTIAGRRDYQVLGERIEDVYISGQDYDVRLPRLDPNMFFNRPDVGSGPPVAYCIVGETLHLYPVPDREYTIGYRANARGAGNDPAEGLFVRWTEDYRIVEDRVYTRVSVSTRELPMPRWATPVDEARRQFFLQRYRGQYEEMCRRAREAPGGTFCCEVVITVQELASGELFAPAPPPAHPPPPPYQEREKAEKRSMELLYDWLTDAQRKELALEQYFTITGEHSGKRYQIHKVYSFGLKELDEAGNVVASYCVVPEGTRALGDTMLAQKVWMETDERATLERANRMSALGSNVMLGEAEQRMLLAQTNAYQNVAPTQGDLQRDRMMQAQLMAQQAWDAQQASNLLQAGLVQSMQNNLANQVYRQDITPDEYARRQGL